MEAKIYISGKIGKETTLLDVIRQYKSFEDPDSVLAIIDSIGGSKEEGDSIYNYLEGLKKDITVKTYAKRAYSIAAKIFAVGEERVVDDVDDAIMIHFAWAKTEGDAAKLEAVAAKLREFENEFASFYSALLNIDEDTSRALLERESFISGEEAVELGFATELKSTLKAVAEFKIDNLNLNSMPDKKEKKGLIKKIEDFLASLKDDSDFQAELTLQDSNGTEIVFPDLEADGTPQIGDAAKIGDAAIPDGSYIMPSLEEATVVFTDGKVSEIIPKEEDPEEDIEALLKKAEVKITEVINAKYEKDLNQKDEEILALKTKFGISEIKAEEIKEISVWSVTVKNTSFEVGDVVEYEYDGESYPVSAGEFLVPDGRRIVTDASGKIVLIKEAEEEATPPVDEEAQAKLIEKAVNKAKEEINAEFQEKLDKKDEEIKALRAKIGSDDYQASEKETKIPGLGKQTGNKAAEIFNAQFK